MDLEVADLSSTAQHKFQVYIVLIFAFAAKPPSLLSTIILPPWGELQSATTTVNTAGDGIIIQPSFHILFTFYNHNHISF